MATKSPVILSANDYFSPRPQATRPVDRLDFPHVGPFFGWNYRCCRMQFQLKHPVTRSGGESFEAAGLYMVPLLTGLRSSEVTMELVGVFLFRPHFAVFGPCTRESSQSWCLLRYLRFPCEFKSLCILFFGGPHKMGGHEKGWPRERGFPQQRPPPTKWPANNVVSFVGP